MIQKNNNLQNIKDILNEYKYNYIPVISEYTKIYTYILDNKVVGFIIFDIIYDRCEIIDIYTNKEYRRNNIAFLLINEIRNVRGNEERNDRVEGHTQELRLP